MAKLELATFGAGCFWGVEELFRQLKGVKETTIGYTGGTTENPTYEEVCSGRTGHVEAIQLKFDPKETTYEKLLDVFWMSHNPLQANGQGNDVGTQYHAVIFYHDEKQRELAKRSKEKIQERYAGKTIATTIRSAKEFYMAENYHQKYLQKRGGIGYCHINVKEILEKVQN